MKFFFVALASCCFALPVLAQPTHPLDPLDASELRVCREVLTASGQVPGDAVFPWVQLQEPPKSEVMGFGAGQPFARRALVVALSRARKTSYECVVDIRSRTLASLRDLKQLQPMLALSEYDRANAVVDADPRIRSILVERGYTFEGRVSDSFQIESFAPGQDAWMRAHPGRYLRVLLADKRGSRNVYGPGVEGLMAYVDLNTDAIVHIVNNPGQNGANAPGVKAPHDIFSEEVLGPARAGLKPLRTAMPGGRSYQIEGNHVTWQGWEFRFSFNVREGLVLHQLGFRDSHTQVLRSILYRGAVSEMLVPYADPSPQWVWREFFDTGEYGLGLNSTIVRPGRELPDNAQVMGAVLPDENLNALPLPNRIYLYERETGLIAFHRQVADESRVYARGRELVVGFVATVGNYDYFYNWVLRQDGSFGFAVDLQGEILSKSVAGAQCEVCLQGANVGPGQTYEATGFDRFGTLVAPQVLGVHHQHWINLRLDFDIDGARNAVKECNTRVLAADAQSNERGRAFTVTHHVFDTEKNAARDASPATNRSWVVYNPDSKSPLGHLAGYEIEPGANTQSTIPSARANQPAGFANHPFWATQYHPQELYAAGAFPNQPGADYNDGLPNYAGNESLFGQDVVVWYNLGYTHLTRPEDYPLMPSGHVEVNFRPKGFFTKSPILDVLNAETP